MAFIDLNAVTPKGYFAGTHRSRSPAATLAAYTPLMPMMGITRLADITGLDRIGLPVVVAVRPNGRSLATSQGKGETPEAAKASALMECIENWHGERIAGPLMYECYRVMREQGAVADVTQLPQLEDAVYHIDRPILWIEGFDLMSGRPMWVPFELVTTNFVTQPGYTPLFARSSNGLASGNSFAEAVTHALCEIIERDAFKRWSFVPNAQRKQSQLDLSTISDPGLERIIEQLRRQDIALTAWDITNDIGVPTYAAIISEMPQSPKWRPIPMATGFGTHLAPEVALSRAIHEAIQVRLTTISGSRDDIFPSFYDRLEVREEMQAILDAFASPPPAVPFGATRPPVADHFEADIRTLLGKLKAVGVESAVAIDLSRPDINVPVARVVVPGLGTVPQMATRAIARTARWQKELAP